jgi:hypothetical protein
MDWPPMLRSRSAGINEWSFTLYSWGGEVVFSTGTGSHGVAHLSESFQLRRIDGKPARLSPTDGLALASIFSVSWWTD